VTDEQIEFGSRLRYQRERRNLSLASIAESTKINQALLAALERGDIAQWPAGLYRRAFIRAYAAAIGLTSESIVLEFVRLFPEPGAPPPARVNPPDAAGALRLTLAPERVTGQLLRKVLAASLDACIVIAIGSWVSVMLSLSVWTLTAITAIGYYSTATALWGSSPVLWLSNASRSRRTSGPAKPIPDPVSSREDNDIPLEMSARLS
jgi:transcriptional regulator with XRE-family HTH domain